jgi:hypothetical protein
MRTKHTFRLLAYLMTKLEMYAARKGVTQSPVLEAALASYLSPDGADRLPAPTTRSPKSARSRSRSRSRASSAPPATAVASNGSNAAMSMTRSLRPNAGAPSPHRRADADRRRWLKKNPLGVYVPALNCSKELG